MTINMLVVVCRTCPDLSFFFVSLPLLLYLRGVKLQISYNMITIMTLSLLGYLTYIYIYIIIYTLGSKTCSSEIFQMVG
jgi:hypothetical protein